MVYNATDESSNLLKLHKKNNKEERKNDSAKFRIR